MTLKTLFHIHQVTIQSPTRPQRQLQRWSSLKWLARTELIISIIMIVLASVILALQYLGRTKHPIELLHGFIEGPLGLVTGLLGIAAFRTVYGQKSFMTAHFVLCILTVATALVLTAVLVLEYFTAIFDDPRKQFHFGMESQYGHNYTIPDYNYDAIDASQFAFLSTTAILGSALGKYLSDSNLREPVMYGLF